MLEDIPLHNDRRDDRRAEIYIQDLTAETLSLKDELLGQYNNARRLYAQIETDDGIPANQKAQVLNTLTSILVQITKSQESLHNSQTFKMMEESLIQTLKRCPEQLQTEFYRIYEETLEQASK